MKQLDQEDAITGSQASFRDQLQKNNTLDQLQKTTRLFIWEKQIFQLDLSSVSFQPSDDEMGPIKRFRKWVWLDMPNQTQLYILVSDLSLHWIKNCIKNLKTSIHSSLRN